MMIDDIYKDPALNTVASISFGLAGAMVVDATKKRGMVLDVYTGEAIILTDRKMEKFIEPYPKLVAKFKKKFNFNDAFEYKKEIIKDLNEIELQKK
jgi:hypothetical protein